MNRQSGLAFAAVLAASALVLSGCSAGGASEPDDKKLVIGSVLYSADAYQLAQEAQLEIAAKEKGYEVVVVNQKLNAETGINGIGDLISRKVDGIIYQPVDPASAVGAIRQAQNAGIPIVAWANKPADSVSVPFLELNESEQTFQAGVDAAKAVQKLFPGDPLSVLVVNISTLSICTDLRMGGFVKGVKSVDPDAQITDVDGKGDRQAATDVTADALESGKKFNIVTGCNGESLLGVLGALRAKGLGQAVDKVPTSEYLFSIDGSPTEIRELLDPSSPLMQVMTLSPKDNARANLKLLEDVISGKIKPDSSTVLTVGSTLLPPDCAVVVKFLEDQYLDAGDVSCK